LNQWDCEIQWIFTESQTLTDSQSVKLHWKRKRMSIEWHEMMFKTALWVSIWGLCTHWLETKVYQWHFLVRIILSKRNVVTGRRKVFRFRWSWRLGPRERVQGRVGPGHTPKPVTYNMNSPLAIPYVWPSLCISASKKEREGTYTMHRYHLYLDSAISAVRVFHVFNNQTDILDWFVLHRIKRNQKSPSVYRRNKKTHFFQQIIFFYFK